MKFMSYEDASRWWFDHSVGQKQEPIEITNDRIQLGALLRIANSSERIVKMLETIEPVKGFPPTSKVGASAIPPLPQLAGKSESQGKDSPLPVTTD